MSWHLDVHLCQGQLKSFQFFGKAKNCYEMAKAASMKKCSHHSKTVAHQTAKPIDKKHCCEDKSFFVQSDIDQINPIADLPIDPDFSYFIIPFISSFLSDETLDKKPTLIARHQVPLISRDTYVLNQAFLL